MTALNNADLLIRQSIIHQPAIVVIGNEVHFDRVKQALRKYPVKVYCGEDSITDVAGIESVDLVLTAMVGFSGLRPTLQAIKILLNSF